MLVSVLWDSTEGVILVEFIQHLVNLFKACCNLRNTLLLFFALVRLLHIKVFSD